MDIGREEIDAWHRHRGFLMVGYNYVVRRNGTVEVGRPEDESGAHARGYNHKSIGIALVGGCTEDDVKVAENNFTSEQWESLDTLVRVLKVNYPKAKVLGHRDLEGVTKECPSFDVQSWLDDSSSVAL
jgi:N-acetylmuramoyl-L-alanine amidase